MTVYTQIIDSINQDKKHTMAGQLSLFDIASEEDKKEFEIRMPQVEEYPKEDSDLRKRSSWHLSQRPSTGALPEYDGKNDLCKNVGFPAG